MVGGISAAVLFAACSGTSFESDTSAVRSVNDYSAKIAGGINLSAEDFDTLRAIYLKYPGSERVAETYKQALIQREDWASLETLITTNGSPSSEEDLLLLGKVYLKLGDYDKAKNALTSMQSPPDAERSSLLAGAYFHTGETAKAEQTLDSAWEKIVDAKQIDGLVLRGLLYFYGGENQKAIEILTSVTDIDPASVAAHNALSRIYARTGDKDKAEFHLKAVEDAYRAMTERTRMQGRMVDQMMRLKEAYESGRHDEVIALANTLLGSADPRNKPALYGYLASSYRALGRNAEADEAQKKAQQMTNR